MNIRFMFFCMFLLCTQSATALFTRDRAAYAAQKNDWKKADGLLKDLVTKHPDDSELLYDTGVSSFELKQFNKAQAYFKNAAQNATNELKQQAHFNCGNSCVELKQLQEAIEQYEAVLAINHEHEKAKHNLEIVKQMLEQEKQQQQNQDQKQQQDKKDNSSDKQQSDQQKGDNSQDDSSDSDNQKQQDERQQSGDDECDQQSKEQDQRKEEGDSSDESEKQQEQQQKNDQSGHENSPEQQKKEEQQTKDNETKKEEQASGGAAQQPEQQKYDKQVMQILAAVDERDAQAHKRMMASRIKQAAGNENENQNNY